MFPLTLGPSFTERRSTTSRCSKETAICIVERWNKGMGYRFVSECNHAKESHYMSIFFSFLFLKPYLQKQGLWRSRNFVSMVTWRNNFFSLFQSLSSPFQTLLALQTNQYEVQNTTLPLAADWFAPNKVDSPNVTIEWIVTTETKASLKDTVKGTCKEA